MELCRDCRAVNTPAKIYRDSAAAEDEILAGVVSEADSPTDTGMKETTEQQQQHQVTSSSARPWVPHQTLTTWPPTQQSHFCSNFYSLIVCGDKNVVGQLCGRAVPDSPGCYNGGDQCTAVAM